MAVSGRKSWGRAMWGAYLSSPKLATEVRRRLELARLEARAEWRDGLEEVAAVRLRQLEGPRPAAPAPELERAAPELEHAAGSGSWWWW